MPVPPVGATQTADHIDAVEDTPLLHDSRDPAETDDAMRSNQQSGAAPSSLELLGRNSCTGVTGWAAQIGLVLATVVLWRVLWVRPAGEFADFRVFCRPRSSERRNLIMPTRSRIDRTVLVPPGDAVPGGFGLPRR